MIRYRNKRITLTIDLPEDCGHEGYAIDCSYSYDKNKNQYLVSMGLWRKDIEVIQPIDTQYVDANKKSIEFIIRSTIENASLQGQFEEYIQDYEYRYKCFDKGNDFYEEEAIIKTCPVKELKIAKITYWCAHCGSYIEKKLDYCPHCKIKLDWNQIIKEETES